MPFTVVDGPEAWTAAEYRNSDRYVYVLSTADVAELDAAVASVAGRDLKVRAPAWQPESAQKQPAASGRILLSWHFVLPGCVF